MLMDNIKQLITVARMWGPQAQGQGQGQQLMLSQAEPYLRSSSCCDHPHRPRVIARCISKLLLACGKSGLPRSELQHFSCASMDPFSIEWALLNPISRISDVTVQSLNALILMLARSILQL